MLAFFRASFTTISRASGSDLPLTPGAAGHIVLRKEQIKIVIWDQTYETR
jgi:hypothetical protein